MWDILSINFGISDNLLCNESPSRKAMTATRRFLVPVPWDIPTSSFSPAQPVNSPGRRPLSPSSFSPRESTVCPELQWTYHLYSVFHWYRMEKCAHEQSCCGDYVIDFIWTPSSPSREPSFNPCPTRKSSLPKHHLRVGWFEGLLPSWCPLLTIFKLFFHNSWKKKGQENYGRYWAGLIPPVVQQNALF